MQFAWDRRKASGNFKKHGVSFEEAETVFSDDLFLVFLDPDHSFEEKRFIIMGESNRGRLLVASLHRKIGLNSNHKRSNGNPKREKSL